MLAIVDYLKSQGFGPETAEHMRIPGIWHKLRTLYNLEALDERVRKPWPPCRADALSANPICLQENAVILDKNEDDDEENEKYWPYEPPHDVFGEMMFERRLAAEGSSSPVTSRHAESRRGSTVADTDGKSRPSVPA